MTDPMSAESATGQWLTAPEGTRWFFDSGSLALDFVYTGSFGGDAAAAHEAAAHQAEMLQTPADLTAWLTSRLPSAEAGDRDLADARTLRGAIGRLAGAASTGDAPDARDIDLLNLYAATPDIPPRLAGGGLQAGRTEPRAAQALSTIARDAVTLFSGSSRIRACDAEDCSMLYLDTSRAGTRRWCSMQRCGNRHKVRAHRERARRSPIR